MCLQLADGKRLCAQFENVTSSIANVNIPRGKKKVSRKEKDVNKKVKSLAYKPFKE